MDSKNYHAWSHRQWCIKFFTRGLPPSSAADAASKAAPSSSSSGAAPAARPNAHILDLELEYIDKLLQQDIRNNSAWNQRFFIRTLPPVSQPLPLEAATEPTFTTGMSADTITTELLYTGAKLLQASHNESAWNYLEGLMKQNEFQHHRTVIDVLRSLGEYTGTQDDLPSTPDYSSSSYDGLSSLAHRFAQSLLVELWESVGAHARAKAAAVKLAEELDQTRRKYWMWRAQQVEKQEQKQAAAAK
jgi:protein farnesyltransferase/geranylgeranyltransferase type-1 subunit alpha